MAAKADVAAAALPIELAHRPTPIVRHARHMTRATPSTIVVNRQPRGIERHPTPY
jgi:hypothetical protein